MPFRKIIVIKLAITAALFAVLALISCKPIWAGGVISLWHGQGNAVDSVSGINGTIHGGVTFVPGIIGNCFSFDGTTGGINIPDDDRLKFTGSFSISTWVYANDIPDPSNLVGDIFFRGDDRSGLDPYLLGLGTNGNWEFLVQNNSGGSSLISAPATLNQWVMLTGTLDNKTGLQTLYVDNDIVAQVTTSVRPYRDLDPNNNPGISIGDSQGYPNSPYHECFPGLIDEIAAYNRCLTAGDIETRYNKGVAVAKLDLAEHHTLGRNTITGTVNLNLAAGPGGAILQLSSSDPSAASVQATVTVPAQATSAEFTIKTSAVSQATTVKISATYHGTKIVSLTVNP